jgi:hypothetical protein
LKLRPGKRVREPEIRCEQWNGICGERGGWQAQRQPRSGVWRWRC